ncbi:MAG: NAD(P)H-binding protein [Steroidobacteraceae bacterium]
MPDESTRIAWVAGASGLTGRLLLEELLAAPQYARVLAITRRPLGREHARLANRVVDYARLESQLAGQACNDAFCCLGTTLRKAGSQQAFRQVDFDEVLRFAKLARAAGAERLLVMSSVGADPAARSFYLRVKGEMEAALVAQRWPALEILQPGLLLGGRRGESRPAEDVGRLVMPLANLLLLGGLRRYRAIEAGVVARAMVGVALAGRKGTRRHTYDALVQAAGPRR